MNIVNRLTCRINENYQLGEIINRINEHPYNEEESDSEDEDILKSFIEISDINEGEGFNFIYGTYYYEYDAPAQLLIISQNGARIRESTIVKRNILDFWITDDNRALFSKSDNPSKKGRTKLSEFLFNDFNIIEPVEFNINQIEESIMQNGEFGGMWTTSFNDRIGAINSGIAYGEDIHEDLVFEDIGNSPKSGTGITYNFMNEQVKVKINKKGTIQIPGKEIMPENIEIFDLIREFDDYIIDWIFIQNIISKKTVLKIHIRIFSLKNFPDNIYNIHHYPFLLK